MPAHRPRLQGRRTRRRTAAPHAAGRSTTARRPRAARGELVERAIEELRAASRARPGRGRLAGDARRGARARREAPRPHRRARKTSAIDARQATQSRPARRSAVTSGVFTSVASRERSGLLPPPRTQPREANQPRRMPSRTHDGDGKRVSFAAPSPFQHRSRGRPVSRVGPRRGSILGASVRVAPTTSVVRAPVAQSPIGASSCLIRKSLHVASHAILPGIRNSPRTPARVEYCR